MQILRIAGVTAGLAVAGALVGGLMGVLLLLLGLVAEGVWTSGAGILLLFGAVYGGLVGAVLGPIAAWLLMRHVPLWKAVGGTAAGTLAGSLLGLLVGGPGVIFPAAFLGFGAAAVYLRLRAPHPAPRAITPSERA